MANHKDSNFNKICIQYCKFCGKECKNINSLKQHELRCKDNPNRVCINNLKNAWIHPWNRGLDKTDERIQKHIETYKLNKSLGLHKSTSHPHTEEFKEKQRKRAIDNQWECHFGSHKSYEYKDVKFVSSYEVCVAKDLDENNIKWIRPKRLKYIDNNGKARHYTPDFYLPEYDVYLDPKNDFLINNVNPKMGFSDMDKINWVMLQNNVKVLVLDKNHLSWNFIKDML